MSAVTKTKTPVKLEASDPTPVLDRLARMINRADDFVLGFVKCNHPSQQKELRGEFLTRLSGKCVLEVELDKPLVSLLDELTARWDPNSPPDVVCVYGLEKSINELQEATPVLGRLNNDRDLLRRAVPVPLLIWLPDFALDFIARGAPDFWAWRSGVYEFATKGALWQRESSTGFVLDAFAISALDLSEKRSEIARLKGLLRSASNLPQQDKREKTLVLGLLFQLGLLHSSLSEWSHAKSYYEHGIEIGKEIRDNTAIERCLHELARLQQIAGDLDGATGLYEQSLNMARRVDDKISIANSLHNMGVLRQSQGRLAEATQLYQQSLEIKRVLGDKKSIASSFQQLGVIQHELGELGNAKNLYQQSLDIKEKTGDKGGMAATLHLLGMLRQEEGDYPEAQGLYERSLTISGILGDKFGQALTEAQIGVLQQAQGHLRQASQNYLRAWSVFDELGATQSKLTANKLWAIREQVGKKQFQGWVTEDYGLRAANICKRLDKALFPLSDLVRQEPAAVC